MRKLVYIFFMAILAISACEEYPEKGTKGNSLIRFYGDAGEDLGMSIVETPGGYALCGLRTVVTRDNTGEYIENLDKDLGLILTDNDGIQQWEAKAGAIAQDDDGRRVLLLDDGSFLCVGVTSITGSNFHKDVLITKISSSGVITWEKHYGGPGNQVGYDVVETPDGGFVVTGSTDVDNPGNENYNGNSDLLFMKINQQGDSIWTNSYGYAGNDIGRKIVYDQGSMLVLGTTDRSNQQGQALRNIILIRITNFGGIDDEIIIGGAGDEVASDIEILPDGYLIAGTVIIGNDDFEGYLVKLNSGVLDQEPLYEKLVDNNGSPATFNSITLLPGNDFMVSGNTGSTVSADMLFMFFDGNGNSSLESHVTGDLGFQSVSDAIIDNEGKIVAVGTNSNNSFSLICLYKFDPWGE